jgi:membrane glycosyltransferase
MPDLTPTGLQSLATLTRRRRLVAALNAILYAALLLWLGRLMSHGGWSAAKVAVVIAFAIAAPWTVLGVCNSTLGLWLLHGRRDGLEQTAPFLAAGASNAPLASRIAMLMTLRNEDAARAVARFRAVKASVDGTGFGERFDWFVLSDTNDPAIARDEEEAVAAWRTQDDAARLHYRRRTNNRGYKAGNIRDFCESFGAGFEFMVPLDADSLMDGETLLAMARIGEAYPRLGILQSLVVGAPSRSAFARIFQFGMRHGMRCYTMGATWWTADCGPFWGHNALVRVAPFRDNCDLPMLKNGVCILSHDQVEAVLMRRAGFEVRVLPVETGSFEENPPTLRDFVTRELRWCRGNMQYVKLWGLPGLLPMSRFHLFWAVSMFIGAPAVIAILLLAPVIAAQAPGDFPVASLETFYLLFLFLHLSPKLAGLIDVALTPGGLRRYGGVTRFLIGAAIEFIGSFIIGAVTTFATASLIVSLPFGRSLGWSGQARDPHALSLIEAARAFWPQTVFGVILCAAGLVVSPELLLWSAPLTFGHVLAIPFASATASRRLGALCVSLGLFRTPEERTARYRRLFAGERRSEQRPARARRAEEAAI